MAITSFPSSGGGGQPNMNFIGSIHMETYNRSWYQAGAAGHYVLYSAKLDAGFAYFVGSGVSTGFPLNRLGNVTHAFTRIDIIAATNDMISLYKGQVKSTSVYNNPFDADASIGKTALSADSIGAYFQFNRANFLVTHNTSGIFTPPLTAMPLINLFLVGGGGGGGRHGGGGGGAGSVVKLTGFPSTPGAQVQVNVGAAGVAHHRSGNNNWGSAGGRTTYGSVYALGGGGGAQHGNNANSNPFGQSHNGHSGNGGGGGGHNNEGNAAGSGTTQTTSTGLPPSGSPAFHGGNNGGIGNSGTHGQGGGGGGAGGSGSSGGGDNNANINGGSGHASDFSGTLTTYSVGASGGSHGGNTNNGPGLKFPPTGWLSTGLGMGGFGGAGDSGQDGTNTSQNTRGWDGGPGQAMVRYYIS